MSKQKTNWGFILFGIFLLISSLLRVYISPTIGWTSFFLILFCGGLYILLSKLALELIHFKKGAKVTRICGMIAIAIYASVLLVCLTLHFFTSLGSDGFYLYVHWILFGIALILFGLSPTTTWIEKSFDESEI